MTEFDHSHLGFYIRQYNNAFDTEFCKQLINKFNKNEGLYNEVMIDGNRALTQINFMQHPKVFEKEIQYLYERFELLLSSYRRSCDIDKYNLFPITYGYEEYRMKKYEAGTGDEFVPHVDCNTYNTSKRFLVFFVYLNDNDMGETEFPLLNIKVKPKAGSAILFPPHWTYLHSGNKVGDTDKYIVGSYLHYKEGEE